MTGKKSDDLLALPQYFNRLKHLRSKNWRMDISAAVFQ